MFASQSIKIWVKKRKKVCVTLCWTPPWVSHIIWMTPKMLDRTDAYTNVNCQFHKRGLPRYTTWQTRTKISFGADKINILNLDWMSECLVNRSRLEQKICNSNASGRNQMKKILLSFLDLRIHVSKIIASIYTLLI